MKDFFVGFALIVLAIFIALHKEDGENRELMQTKQEQSKSKLTSQRKKLVS